MNYPALRWVVEKSPYEGAAHCILFTIAYRADRDTGECWAGQRRIARDARVSRKSVERWFPRFVSDGVLESVEEGSGPQPDRYRFAPDIVEGESFGSGIVEGQATATAIVEGEAIAGEVIHSPSSSGDMVSPVASEHDELVATLLRGTGDMVSNGAELVATSGDDSGYSHVPLSSEDAEKGLKQGSLRSREVQVVGDNNASVVADAAEPPPVSDADKRYLQERFGPPTPPRPVELRSVGRPPRPREEQLAELERMMAEDEAQERQEQAPAVEAPAGAAEGNGQAQGAMVAIAVHAQPAVITFGAVVG